MATSESKDSRAVIAAALKATDLKSPSEKHMAKRALENENTADSQQGDAVPADAKRAKRQRAQVNYRPTGQRIAAQTVTVKEEIVVELESAAIKDLSPSSGPFRLVDFEVVNESGEQQPLDRLQHHKGPLWLAGLLHSLKGNLSKEIGKRVPKFGPLVSWQIQEDKAALQILVKTPAAEYVCVKPSLEYRQVFLHTQEQAKIAFEVQKALSPKYGGKPIVTMEEIVARLSRAKIGKSYASAREALLLNGSFVMEHLKAVETQSRAGSGLSDTAFAAALEDEVAALQSGGGVQNGSMVINERAGNATAQGGSSAERRSVQADADYARQLQAKMDAQETRAAYRRGGTKAAAYIKISEAEIADDYPEPTQYEKIEDETDELLLADDEMFDVDPEALPRRLLSDFSVYNSEGLMSTLELLPMWGGAAPDVDLFFSGDVFDDDGEWAGGQTLGASADEAGASSSSGAAGSSSAAAGGSSAAGAGPAGGGGNMRIYSSQIQEWLVEYSCDRLFITIRTDVAWYRLAEPAAVYKPWFGIVLESARLAVKILTLLSEETRASKLSFQDMLKRLASTESSDPTYISTKVDSVQRFVVVHGQILLNQFKHFPVKSVRESAFALALKGQMELRRHAKLYLKPAKAGRGHANSNPMRDRASVKAAPMTATATTMVKAVWQSYFSTALAAADKESEAAAVDKGPAAVEVQEDLNEEDDEAEVEDALVEDAAAAVPKVDIPQPQTAEVCWLGEAIKSDAGKTLYRQAKIGEVTICVGDVIALESMYELGLVQAMWQGSDGKQCLQLRSVLRGQETVLGDAASSDELFVTSQFVTRPMEAVTACLNASRLRRSWNLQNRRQEYEEDKLRHENNTAAAASKLPLQYIYRSLYLPEEGMLCQMPEDLGFGETVKEGQQKAQGAALTGDGRLQIDGVQYEVGDFVFLRPGVLDELEEASAATSDVADYASKGRFHKGGANSGLRPYGIAQLVSLGESKEKKIAKNRIEGKVEVLRFYRPDDISQEEAYRADYWDVYASNEKLKVSVGDLVSKCSVSLPTTGPTPETFICRKTYQRKSGKFTEPPATLKLGSKDAKGKAGEKGTSDIGKGKISAPGEKGKGSAKESAAGRRSTAVKDGISLASMDIFAGCGGLTEGLHQAKAAHAKWAIEYEDAAAEAFRLNHPEATCWAKNCNVILTAAMQKAGMTDLCAGSPEAEAQAAQLDPETVRQIPVPGEVDFLCGGPPCQGFSGMNRFNRGNWSMVQNSMVMAYLSFADFYRPRYFLLENVRNFVSHNKSFTFRLTLRSLLEMGYQVRFGVLNAGNFGVSQSRKRTFIWAAAPGDLLPDWPQLLHIFRSPQLTINLPGNVRYSAVPQTEGAPLRTVTVKDVISDLPPITNGQCQETMHYSGPAVSAFQKKIRGEETELREHICKEMNALNLERCRCIPKEQPGADWRVLQTIVEEDPSREKYQGQPLVPWCLPNTAERHNGWRGLFGRLDWNGHFPTSTTDPQPMGKVGQVFHPNQDRIVSVRECARAQGFPDSFRFYGNVHNKHRQIGNAVPPPLAFNLGKCLRKALEKTASKKMSILEAQMAGLD